MAWLELSVAAAREAVDWACMLLAANGYTGNVVVRQQADAEAPSANGHIEPGWESVMHCYLPASDTALMEKIDAGLATLRRTGLIGALQVERVAEQPVQPGPASSLTRRIGRRFVVLAPGEDAMPRADERVVWLTPSLTFGSGLHPTTEVSLHLLERHGASGMQVLDLGCGSGILSVALAKLGARVLALDNDPAAVQAAKANVELNAVQQQVTVMQGSLGTGARLGHWMGWMALGEVQPIQGQAAFDLIVANILARVHIALTHDYRRALRRTGEHTGILITAGYTAERTAEVTAALAEAGFELIDRQQTDEWVALAHRLPA